MTDPIKVNKPKSSMKIENAPTPHNTPAGNMEFFKNGNPMKGNKSNNSNADSNDDSSNDSKPQTINEEDIKTVLSNQPLLLQSIQEKLGSLIGQDSGYVENLPKVVKNRIYALKSLQTDLFQIEKDFQVEMFELEQKYLTKYAPVHLHRKQLIVGEIEPTEEEINKGKELEDLERGEDEEAEDEEEEAEEEEEEDEGEYEGVPSFWLTALENLPVVSDTITDRDAEVLEYLTDVKLEYCTSGKPGFKLIFEFDDKENPFFTNKELVKTYYYQSELGYSGDFIYDHAEGNEIKWVDNESNVTVSVEMRKQRNKSTKQVRTIEKITPIESFFNFFDPPKIDETHQHSAECEGGEEEEEEEYEDLEQRLALDYSIGEQIKDKLIPRAVDWFTGSALEFEYDNGEEEEFEDEEDYDEDEEEEGEEEEDDDFAGKKEEAPECKQS
ncbi:hypothetical protein Kpol_1031p27 [Vanderwaltozyma polyspora DSM 70294]|uniref:Nucleosome assembly protein n=1 Tax=Vanderwaltozyma polyspora (strain ATCC 22028 / DSM 70294 / BCRC 21397 / CBS 2163 / NBRC 10782 / NRRL Y-8283 / UCD 57-17) TaxID=436907 RepID=A7THW1_VANPO|nr:uncharacterized protein Kpol_1031p27 [Vanderwaltozyma polyspora DSM 70294]EDO18123.1 hypothetical protein Kpol_1031p27 [Vanderwaltozyma polyspora DSM 70294]